jgi:hypothetical protein
MYKWNDIQNDTDVSDKVLLKDPYGWKPYIVEGAFARVLVEIMEWIEARVEIQKAPLEAPVRGPKKGK